MVGSERVNSTRGIKMATRKQVRDKKKAPKMGYNMKKLTVKKAPAPKSEKFKTSLKPMKFKKLPNKTTTKKK